MGRIDSGDGEPGSGLPACQDARAREGQPSSLQSPTAGHVSAGQTDGLSLAAYRRELADSVAAVPEPTLLGASASAPTRRPSARASAHSHATTNAAASLAPTRAEHALSSITPVTSNSGTTYKHCTTHCLASPPSPHSPTATLPLLPPTTFLLTHNPTAPNPPTATNPLTTIATTSAFLTAS